MPAPIPAHVLSPLEEELWDALKDKQYETAKAIIRANPALVNSVDTKHTSVLSKALGTKPPSSDFIQFLSEQPTLNLQYKNPKTGKADNIENMIFYAIPEIFAFFEKHPAILRNGSKGEDASYVFVKKLWENAKKSLAKEVPGSDTFKLHTGRVSRYEHIMNRLHALTLVDGNPDLIKQLQDAQAVVAPAIPNRNALFTPKEAASERKSPSASPVAASKGLSVGAEEKAEDNAVMRNLERYLQLTAQKEKIEVNHHSAQIGIYAQAADGRVQRMQKAGEIMSREEIRVGVR